jgi:hypothetical protein
LGLQRLTAFRLLAEARKLVGRHKRADRIRNLWAVRTVRATEATRSGLTEWEFDQGGRSACGWHPHCQLANTVRIRLTFSRKSRWASRDFFRSFSNASCCFLNTLSRPCRRSLSIQTLDQISSHPARTCSSASSSVAFAHSAHVQSLSGTASRFTHSL